MGDGIVSTGAKAARPHEDDEMMTPADWRLSIIEPSSGAQHAMIPQDTHA